MMDLNRIEETTLWKQLDTDFYGEDKRIANILSVNLVSICKEASDRMKKCLVIHKQFTLHDETHLLRVTEIISKILGHQGLIVLNPVEIFLLILASFYHDIGMVMDDDEIASLHDKDDFKFFKSNWIVNHPNYRETQSRINDKFYNDDIRDNCLRAYNDLQSALLTDYIRKNHGALSKQFVETNYSSNPLWQINGVNIAGLIGKLCLSHNHDIQLLSNEHDFRVDENIVTYKVNMPYLAILLRLADILDFDKERTPDSLYKSIHFTSNISLNEWEKHRSVVGWEISKDIIRFSVQCTHPIYQKAVLEFMDWIDDELNNAKSIISNFPSRVSKYTLNLPIKVDRSRIQPKDNSYIYHDLEFSLSRDEIVKLLMMDELYKSSSLCVRELLQNSLDALRYRKSTIKSDLGIDWNDGKVIFKHYLDEYGREVLLCEDNGIGMDENIIQNYLTKTGRSYYKSPAFEIERETLKQKGIDFYPCSQFGIGFMSCFMIGDSIIIKTRKDYGYGKQQGKPLIVEINGLNGIIVIKEGESSQPIGTSVYITGRAKPDYFDEWEDKVWLLEVLDGYALACEFPIEAHCTIDEIRGALTIPTGIIEPKTFIEKSGISSKSYKTYEQNLSEVHSNLRGKIKVSFLVNENGKLTVDNTEAYWDCTDVENKNKFTVKDKPKENIYYEANTATCCDGILVCGTPGLNRHEHHRLGERANVINLGYETFILDIRDRIKPRLTPSRIAKEDHYNVHPSWRSIQDLMDIAQGKLWAKVLEDIDLADEIITFLQLASIYRFNLNKLPIEILLKKMYIPFREDSGGILWLKLSSLDNIRISKQDEQTDYYYIEKSKIALDDTITQYDSRSYGVNSLDNVQSLVIRMSALWVSDDSELFLHIASSELNNSYDVTKYDSSIIRVLFIPYYSASSKYFSIQAPFRNINMNHPLAEYIQKNKYQRENNTLLDFALSLMFFVTDSTNFDDMKKDKITKQMKRLGCKYQTVNWDEYPDYKPDYISWTKDGVITFTHDIFVHWAQTKNEDLVKDF